MKTFQQYLDVRYQYVFATESSAFVNGAVYHYKPGQVVYWHELDPRLVHIAQEVIETFTGKRLK